MALDLRVRDEKTWSGRSGSGMLAEAADTGRVLTHGNGPIMDPRTPEAAEERKKPRPCDAPCADSFLFDDPYWDDAFDSYHDPTLRTCCRF